MFGSINKTLVVATKNLFVVPNFVAVTKPFFSVIPIDRISADVTDARQIQSDVPPTLKVP